MVDQHAYEASLSEQDRARADILDYLLRKVEKAEAVAARACAQAERATDLAVSNRQQIEENTAQLRDVSRAEEILHRATVGEAPHPRHAAQRDRHGMHIVRGSTLAAAVAAVGRWSWRAGAHRAATSALLVAAAGATTVAAPSLMMTGPPPARAAIVAPHHVHGRRRARTFAPVAAGPRIAAAHHERGHGAYDDDDILAPDPSPDPSPTWSPSPVPSASVTPQGTPGPTVSPSPGPTNSAQGSGG